MRILHRSAGRLSRHRRRPLAGLVVLVLGLLLTGGLYAAFSPAQAGETATDETQVEAGRELFITGCAFCHGENGEGVLTQRGTQYGPALTDVGAASVDFQVGTGRMPLAQPGQQALRKPSIYSDEETEQLAAYVASLGAGPAIPTEEDINLPAGTDEEAAIARGGQIFLTNCTACHNFDGSGGAMPRGGFAPDIRGVSGKHIYEALLTGPQSMPSFSNGSLPPEAKQDVIAFIRSTNETPGYGGFGLGSLGPVSEGLFTWVVGVGGLVGFAIWVAAHTTRSNRQKSESPSTSLATTTTTRPDDTGATA